MNLTSLISKALRGPLYQYCRRSPINAGKVQLVYLTRRIEIPDTKWTLLPNGTRIWTDLSDAVQRLIYFLGNYEPGVTRVVIQTLKPGDVFLDIGAHIGYFTLLASTCVGPDGLVYCFEPQPKIFDDLKKNIYINDLQNVRPICCAVFDSERELDIFSPVEGNSGTATFLNRPDGSGASIKCPATTVDAHLQGESIEQVRLIKMDIEGAEPFALKGMSKLLSSNNPPDIICEAVPYLLSVSGHKQIDLINFLEPLGYVCRLITNTELTKFDPNIERSPVADCNLLFTHRRTLNNQIS